MQLINLVANIAFDNVRMFSPKDKQLIEAYPTVQTIDRTPNKKSGITVDQYQQRFQIYWAWFHLAKAVARFTGYKLQEEFMQDFNHPDYWARGYPIHLSLEVPIRPVLLAEGRLYSK